MLAYNGTDLFTCPVKARNLSGRTGRGDTTFAAYLAMRMTGAAMKEALLYATACVSLKICNRYILEPLRFVILPQNLDRKRPVPL